VGWGGGGEEPDQGVTSVEGNPATTSCMNMNVNKKCFVALAWTKTRTWLWVWVEEDDGCVDCRGCRVGLQLNELYVVCGLTDCRIFFVLPFLSLLLPLLRSYGRSVET
jgi:hypothetical protein